MPTEKKTTAASSVQLNSPDSLLRELTVALNAAELSLQNQNYFEAFEMLGPRLSELHDSAQISGVTGEARAHVRAHPVFRLCHDDPYTKRAFHKPRGYAGDAVMLDYVYAGVAPENTCHPGQGIFQRTTRGPMGLSVLYRRSLLSAYINDVVARNPEARILSVASGHCRELEGTLVLGNDFRGEVVAFDQDPESCAEVSSAYPKGVKPVIGRVKGLLGGEVDMGQFDLIYSAGLYDYLLPEPATTLTNMLKGMLKPKGRLLISNFSRGSYGRGYLDWVMDWHLLYRDEAELLSLLGDTSNFKVKSFSDPHDNVLYAELALH
jgi:SAM-dependent methyltransferase